MKSKPLNLNVLERYTLDKLLQATTMGEQPEFKNSEIYLLGQILVKLDKLKDNESKTSPY